MSNEVWFMKFAPLAVLCPKCGGKVWFGMDYDWPPELGGNYIEDRCQCASCKSEWRVDDAPPEFTAKDGECWNVDLDDYHEVK
jgi:hypothetical protein